jgi:hypothetical protein
LKPEAAGVVAAEVAACAAVVVSHAAVQRRAVASHRDRQLAGHRGGKPNGNDLATVIETAVIGRNVVMKSRKTARITVKMHARIARITSMTGGMTTMIIIIMAAQPT